MADNRMRWKGRFEFVFASFGYTIGLGNLWRFPQRCYSNGGGVFLIPYLLCIILCTIPTLFLEFSLGQLKSEGCIKVWKFAPLIQGIGLAIWFNLLMTVIYYNVLLMYILYYMLVSLVNIGSTLPWSKCRPEDDWSTDKCRAPVLLDRSDLPPEKIIDALKLQMNTSCIADTELVNGISSRSISVEEFETTFSSCRLDFVTPEEEYWTRLVLGVHESNGFDNLGAVSGRNAVMLLTIWLIVYYCCVRGIRSIAKVTYVTATFPFLMLFILLFRGVSLEGHSEGIRYYMKPDWSKLSDLQIWSSGATQAIYSLGVGFGSQISLASHNYVNNNVLRDAILIGIVNSCVSFFGGFVVFTFLGHASARLGQPVNQIFDHGPGILFISYVQGISQLPAASFWSCLFFMTVFTFGLDSEFVMVWTLYDSIQDYYPGIFKKRGKWILLGICVFLFLLGLPQVTNGGIHVVMLMDRYTSDFTLVFFVIMEMVAVCWIYGINRFISDLESIIGRRSKRFWWFWKFTWMASCPAYATATKKILENDKILCQTACTRRLIGNNVGLKSINGTFSRSLLIYFILIASGIGYTKSSYAGVEVTKGGEAVGWLLIITPFLVMLLFGVYQIHKHGIRRALKRLDDQEVEYSRPDPQGEHGMNEENPNKSYLTAVYDPKEIQPGPASRMGDIDTQDGPNVTYENVALEDFGGPPPCGQ